MELNLSQKLDFLWGDFLEFIDKGVAEKKYPQGIEKNFQKLKGSDIQGFKNDGKKAPPLIEDNSSLIDAIPGKILLSLSDVAILCDNGFENFISGSFEGYAKMLEKYMESRDVGVFNPFAVVMNEMSEIPYMPFLNFLGRDSIKQGLLARKYFPISLLSHPYFFNYTTKQIDWLDTENSERQLFEDEKKDIVEMVVRMENERIKDMALIMLNMENLFKIGFNRFFTNAGQPVK